MILSLCAVGIQNQIKKCSFECWKMRGSHELSVSERLQYLVTPEIGSDFEIVTVTAGDMADTPASPGPRPSVITMSAPTADISQCRYPQLYQIWSSIR